MPHPGEYMRNVVACTVLGWSVLGIHNTQISCPATQQLLSLHDMPLLHFEQNQEICIPDYLPLGNVPKLVIDIPNTTN